MKQRGRDSKKQFTLSLQKILSFSFFLLIILSTFKSVWSSKPSLDINLLFHQDFLIVGDTTAYPGSKNGEITVWLYNNTQIGGFNLLFSLSRSDLIDFTTQGFHVNYDSTWETLPPPPHWRIDTTAVRDVRIDRNGSLTTNFSRFNASSDAGDTTKPDCKYTFILGIAGQNPIPVGNGLLFRLVFDALPIADSIIDRTVGINVYGQYTDASGNNLYNFDTLYTGSVTLLQGMCGDVNADGVVDIGDIVFLINYVFYGGSTPGNPMVADVNADAVVDIGDIVYLINYVFYNGTAPSCFS